MLVVLIALYAYKSKVLNILGKYGFNNVAECLPSQQFKQLKQYKIVCIENKLSLKWYKFLAAYPFIGIFLVLGWIVLVTYAGSKK